MASNRDTPPSPPLRLLILEDNPPDAKLVISLLKREGYAIQAEVTDSRESFEELLKNREFDIILADFNLGGWTALDALELVKQSGKDIPLIVITGSIGDEAAVDLIKRGASDYVLKDRPARLPVAIRQAMEEKLLRQEHQKAEAQMRLQLAALESAANGIVITDRNGTILWANAAYSFFTGYSPEELIGKNPRILKSSRQDASYYKQLWETILAGKVWHGELINRRKDGSLYDEEMTITPVLDSQGAVANFIAIKQDVTERKRTAEKLRKAERALRALSGCNQVLVRATTEAELLQEVCGILVEVGGYHLAWVGYAEHDAAKTVRPMAYAGHEGGYLQNSPIVWSDTELGRRPTGTAIRTGKPCVVQRIGDPRFPGWAEQARTRGFESCVALPLQSNGQTFGTVAIHAEGPDAFDEHELALLTELSEDLAYGIQALRTQVERREAEFAQRDSEARFRLLFIGNPLPMWVYDLETLAFLEVNDAAVAHYGYSRDEFLKMRLTDIRPPEELGRLRKNLAQGRQALEESGPWRHQLKNGQIILAQITSHLLPWNGRASALVVAQDITERAGAELALRESEERYRALFEGNLAGVFRTTVDGRVLECNQATANILGFHSPGEVKNLRVQDLYLSDQARANFLERLQAEGRLSNFELHWRRKDGSPLWLIANVSLTTPSPDGEPTIEGTLIDITERKRAETENSRLAVIVNSSDDAIYSTTREGLITTWNAGAERMYGYSADEIEGKHFAILIPEAKRGGLDAFMERLYRGEAILYYDREHIRKDGVRMQVSLTLSPIKDAADVVTGISVISRDITERKRAEEELREQKNKAQTYFDIAGVMLLVLDPDQQVVLINSKGCEILGYPREEIIGKRWSDHFLPARDRDLMNRAFEKLKVGELETVEYLENAIVSKTGEERLIAWHNTVLRDGTGKIVATLSSGEDITERKRAEEDLLLKTALLEAQAETTIDGILVVDLADRILLANRQFARMWNIPDQVIATKDDKQVIPLALGQVKAPDSFLERVHYLNAHEREESRDELELNDGRVFDRYSSPLQDFTGRLLGRIWYFRDITERKRAEEALRRSAAILSAGERLTQTGSWSWNVVSGELYWSEETYRIFGFDPAKDKASIRDTFLPRIHPEDRAYVEEGLRNPQGQMAADYRVVLPDGSIRQIHDIAYPVTDATGKLIERFGVACDVTERKEAEAALRASEERFRRIAETITEVFWIADPQITRMIYVSPAYEQVWGRSVKSLYENPRSFVEAVHSADRDQVLAVLATQIDGKPFAQEYRIVRPDGSTHWIWDRGFPVRDEAGALTAYVGVAQDITERKRAEAENARLATAIEQSAEAVMMTDPQGKIEYVNPAFTRITGYTREEVLGQNPRILKSDKQDSEFYRQLWATILAGQTWQGEIVNRRKDGSLYNERTTIAPVRNAHGEITHFIDIKEDVTERKVLEEQLQKAAKMEAVGRLAGGVAHDFNNLLTVMNGYSELLLEMLGSDNTASTFVKEIKSAGDRAATLTRQLLAFSRQQVLAPQVLDLNSVVANIDKMLRRLIGEDVKLRTTLAPELRRVKADPGQIEQVIMNLAVNARDAMLSGGSLTIETGNVELDETYAQAHVTVKPGPHVMLAVSDTGVGMAPEIKARIFEPFFTTKEQGKGTGLGLATVYGIVKQSGGSIWVYSELGQGTVFKVYFPAVSEAPETAPPRTQPSPASGTETILVVEDEESVRSLIQIALASAGYQVLATADAEKAAELCASHPGPIHLLLTDVVMPRMSGPLVAQTVTAVRPEIKVLFMSGYTDEAIVHHGALRPGTNFIQKPFSPVQLRWKVREALDRK